MQTLESVVIFGGTGFIGTHLTQHLLRENLARRIVLADLAPPRKAPYASLLDEAITKGTVRIPRH